MSAVLTPPPMPPAAPTRLTAEQFAKRYAGQRVELLFGRVVELPMPFQEHGNVCNWAAFYLTQHVAANGLGRVTTNDSFVRVPMPDDADKVRGADVCYFSYDRLPRGRFPSGLLDVTPELVVEVRSTWDTWAEIYRKVAEYLANDILVVLVFDPDTQSVTVFRPAQRQQAFEEHDTLTVPDVLPGWSVPVASFFA